MAGTAFATLIVRGEKQEKKSIDTYVNGGIVVSCLVECDVSGVEVTESSFEDTASI
jgi:hypothetical protein